jgi:hypothetical protein
MPATITREPPTSPETGVSVREPASPLPLTDQEKFDAEVARDGGIFLHVVGAIGIMA